MTFRRFGVVLAVAAATGGVTTAIDRLLVPLDAGIWAALLVLIMGCALACDPRAPRQEDGDRPR